MAKKSGRSTGEAASALAEIIRNGRLAWRLIRDPQVHSWLKAIPAGSLLYLILPFDFVPDFVLGMGQLDDIAILLLGIKLFIALCPDDLVAHHLQELGSVPASYTVSDDEPDEETPQYLEGVFRPADEEG